MEENKEKLLYGEQVWVLEKIKKFFLEQGGKESSPKSGERQLKSIFLRTSSVFSSFIKTKNSSR